MLVGMSLAYVVYLAVRCLTGSGQYIHVHAVYADARNAVRLSHIGGLAFRSQSTCRLCSF